VISNGDAVLKRLGNGRGHIESQPYIRDRALARANGSFVAQVPRARPDQQRIQIGAFEVCHGHVYGSHVEAGQENLGGVEICDVQFVREMDLAVAGEWGRPHGNLENQRHAKRAHM